MVVSLACLAFTTCPNYSENLVSLHFILVLYLFVMNKAILCFKYLLWLFVNAFHSISTLRKIFTCIADILYFIMRNIGYDNYVTHKQVSSKYIFFTSCLKNYFLKYTRQRDPMESYTGINWKNIFDLKTDIIKFINVHIN